MRPVQPRTYDTLERLSGPVQKYRDACHPAPFRTPPEAMALSALPTLRHWLVVSVPVRGSSLDSSKDPS
ncbi:hypothetical protein TNCV_1284301 [Trichonephila clavipes]|uniref:Uncharacterized protein n=1 Tax=Trichonephila clavipes TaxID=2585209 RepID=A0A8X6VQ93_TRICX|nr:hypothetical protein TNCV_1284301 [Trichonephila clavipes]